VARRMREARQRAGLSLEQMGRSIQPHGRGMMTVHRREKGRVALTMVAIEETAIALGVDVVDLLPQRGEWSAGARCEQIAESGVAHNPPAEDGPAVTGPGDEDDELPPAAAGAEEGEPPPPTEAPETTPPSAVGDDYIAVEPPTFDLSFIAGSSTQRHGGQACETQKICPSAGQ